MDRGGRGAGGIAVECAGRDAELLAQKAHQLRRGAILEVEPEARVPQQCELHRKPDAVGIVSPGRNQRQVVRGQQVPLGKALSIDRDAEQRRSFGIGEKIASRHDQPSTKG